MKLKWYQILGLIGVVMFVIFWINHSFTNWESGILIYEGFIPQPWDMLFMIIPVFLWLVCIGASIENGINRIKPCHK